MLRVICLALLGLGFASSTMAEPRNYALDMGHSRIFFDIDHRGFSTMLGRFANFGGTFLFDAENPTASSLNIEIDAASVDMFHEGLNNHLKTADFFNVAEHPQMTFVSERIESTGENQYKVHGQFTLLGQTHPLALDVVLNKTGETRNGAPMAGFSARGTLDRTAYGMNYGTPLIGREVALRIEIEASAASES